MVLLSVEPPLYAGASIKNLPANKRPWWAHAEHFPAVERTGASPKFRGEFFPCQKFCEDRFSVGHVISCNLATVRPTEIMRAAIRFGMEGAVMFSLAQPCLDRAVAVSDPSRA
jgi:hypothetical protein